MTFREALRIRLDIIKPSYEKVQELNRQQATKLTPRIKCDIVKEFVKTISYFIFKYSRDLIDLLHEKNIPVYLISGGFRLIINSVADLLKISHDNVFANTLLFEPNGSFYLNF